MARREVTAQSAEARTQFLERGNIYFFYRPRVGVETVRRFEDLQRLYMVLGPHGKRTYRLIIIAEKRLPALRGGGDRKSWGFVQTVSHRPDEVEDELDPESYSTKTRGERHQPAARPAGEGVYTLVRHRDHTHLAYALELPDRPGDVQRTLNIHREGSYTVAVKNPDAPSPPGVGLDEARKANFPEPLRRRFEGRRFIAVDPPEFLDHEGAEILLVGARADASAELGAQLNPERETEATAEIFNDLRLEKSMHPLTPLFEGKWA